MNARLPVYLAAALFLGIGFARGGDPAAESDKQALLDEHRVPLDVARDRAKLMHTIYSTTLDVVHHHYFHGDRAMVPARAMEDVFSHLNKEMNVNARWIAVNTKAMSLDHEPESEFDKQAAKEMAGGKTEVERVEKGVYYRAAPIPLTGSCVTCHLGFFRNAPKTPRLAGLVVSIPIKLSSGTADNQ